MPRWYVRVPVAHIHMHARKKRSRRRVRMVDWRFVVVFVAAHTPRCSLVLDPMDVVHLGCKDIISVSVEH